MARAGLAAAELARELAGDAGRAVSSSPVRATMAATRSRPRLTSSAGFIGSTSCSQAMRRSCRTTRAQRAREVERRRRPAAEVDPGARTRYDLVVDGLFGIGLVRPLAGATAELVRAASALRGAKLALDIPSGINADTGAVMGTAFRATHTITFIARKPGLLHAGRPRLLRRRPARDARPRRCVARAARGASRHRRAPSPRRCSPVRVTSTRGSPAASGSSAALPGWSAPRSSPAARRSSSVPGKVFLGLVTEPAAVRRLRAAGADAAQARAAPRGYVPLTAIAAGPGSRYRQRAQRLLAQALRLELPLVLDADALNLVAAYGVLQSAVLGRKAPTMLTPHPAEARGLAGCTTAEIQADRIAAASASPRSSGRSSR